MVILLNSPIPVHLNSLIPKLLTLTLAISCLITSNFLIHGPISFQVPFQYFSLQHWTLLPSPVTSTTGWCFALAPPLHSFWNFPPLTSSSIPTTHWSPGTYQPGEIIFSVSYLFCLFIVYLGFSRQEYWSGFPFPSPVDHILSALSTMTHPSWVAVHSMAHCFIE